MDAPTARAAIRTLTAGTVRQDGFMRVSSDQYGAFGQCGSGGASFNPDSDAGSRNWLCIGFLMLTDGTDLHWLADINDWPGQFALPDENVLSDTVNDTRTGRTSSFLVELANLQVDLVQETPSAGYNFLQTYTFTNTGGEALSLKIVWFNDQDLLYTGSTPANNDNRVGFVLGEIPRAYFIVEPDLAGMGEPGIADRDLRISVAARMGDGVTFDGYYGTKPPGIGPGAGDVQFYLEDNRGIRVEDLNTIQAMGDRGSPSGIDLDIDGDRLIDEQGDVAAAMQFSMNLAAGASTSLAFDYIGGSLSHAVFDIVPKPLSGDFDLDGSLTALDIDQLSAEIRRGGTNVSFDLNSDSRVDTADRTVWVHDLRKTYFGDANLDGQFNSTDMIAVFQAGQYEDMVSGNSGWSTGDWDGDGDFKTGDLVAAFQDGGYEKGPRPAMVTVPEPSPWLMFWSGLLAWLGSRSGRRT
jgi:hypothetical protein